MSLEIAKKEAMTKKLVSFMGKRSAELIEFAADDMPPADLDEIITRMAECYEQEAAQMRALSLNLMFIFYPDRKE